MAQSLRIANFNGTSVQYLSRNAGTDPKLIRYVPRTPDLSALDFTAETMRDGGERFVTTRRNVTESARIWIEGATAAAVRTIVQSIETLFRRAEEWQRFRVNEPYYIFHTPDGYLSPHQEYRSEILSGRIDLADRAFDYGYWTGHVEALVTWTRRFYWEDSSETTLSLANSNSSGAAIAVINNPASYNYVDVTGTAIIGTIPAPAILTVQNAESAPALFSLYMGVNSWNTPSGFTHVIQGEAAASGGSTTVDANASGGNRRDFTLTGTETAIGTWTLSDTTIVKPAAGRYFRLIGRFAIESTALPVPFGIRPVLMAGSEIIWSGGETIVTASYALRDLGIVPLPPYQLPFLEAFTLGDLTLVLNARTLPGASLSTLRLDCIQLTPTDSYRALEPVATGIVNGRRIIDDPGQGLLYQENTSDSGGRRNLYVASGSPIWLWPGKDTRVIMLHSTSDNGANIARVVTVSMKYRPRRLTI